MSKPRIEWLERQIAKIEDRVLARELGYLIDAYTAAIATSSQSEKPSPLEQAAPDLLEALKYLYMHTQSTASPQARSIAREAIRKAEGQDQGHMPPHTALDKTQDQV